jgi:hypothetical protein
MWQVHQNEFQQPGHNTIIKLLRHDEQPEIMLPSEKLAKCGLAKVARNFTSGAATPFENVLNDFTLALER